MNSIEKNLEKVLNELLTLAEVQRKKTVFTIGIAPRKRVSKSVFFPFVRESSLTIIGNVEVDNLKDAKIIAKAIDGIVDYILIDDEKKSKELLNLYSEVKKVVNYSVLLSYKDSDAWVEATDALVNLFLEDNLDKNILICKLNNLSAKLALKLCERGSIVYLLDKESPEASKVINSLNYILPEECPSKITYCIKLPKGINFNAVISFSIDNPVLDLNMIKKFSSDTIIVDAGIGSIDEKAINYALENNFTIFRLDMRAGLSGNIINVIETYDLKHNIYGRKKLRELNIVAGGFFGLEGDIVVDSITHPTRVIGVADGKGHLTSAEYLKNYEEKIREVEKIIIKNFD